MKPVTHDNVVRLTVTNQSSIRATLVLEPAGEVYELLPGGSQEVIYAGGPNPHLTIDVSTDEIKVWQEGRGTLELRHRPG